WAALIAPHLLAAGHSLIGRVPDGKLLQLIRRTVRRAVEAELRAEYVPRPEDFLEVAPRRGGGEIRAPQDRESTAHDRAGMRAGLVDRGGGSHGNPPIGRQPRRVPTGRRPPA